MARRRKPLGPKQIDHLEEEYGLSYALFKSFPELNHLLQQAIRSNWTPQKFQVELRQTDWFKNHSDVWRKNIGLKKSDPASYRERLFNTRSAFRNIADSLGVTLSPKMFNRLSERALLFGWDEGQMRNTLSNYVRPSRRGDYGGQLASAENNLSQLAYRNGVRVSRGQMRTWMRQLARGDGSEEEFSNWIRNLSANTFRPFADQIRNGADLMDIASPYMETMAQTLELNPNQIDPFDRTIRRVLSGQKNDKGDFEAISLTDFEDSLRRDRRWQFTQTAQDQARGYVNAISKIWGLS